MYELFTKRYKENNDIIKPGQIDLVIRNYQKEIKKIEHYYRNSGFSVGSKHLFCRIITTALSGMSLDLYKFNQLNDLRANNYARHFELVSEVSFGKFRKDFLYKGLTSLLSVTEYYSVDEAFKNWQDLRPVEVIYHNVSNTRLLIPDDPNHNSEEGINYVKIDIPKLLLMYRAFYEKEIAVRSAIDGGMGTIAQFVMKHVLPNMLRSHIEIVIFNRFNNLLTGKPMGESYKNHPFPIMNQDRYLDTILMELVKHVQRKPMHYYSVLKLIPSVFHEDFQEFGLMPDLAPTKQVWWCLLMSKSKVIEALMIQNPEKGRRLNNFYIQDLRLDLQRLNRDNSLAFMKQDDLFMDDLFFAKEYSE
jgi:hypothetical protein